MHTINESKDEASNSNMSLVPIKNGMDLSEIKMKSLEISGISKESK